MRKTVLASLVLAMGLSGCSGVRDSGLNPFNWFGGSTSRKVVAEPQETEVNPLIPKRRSLLEKRPDPPYAGTLVQDVTEVHARRTPGGAVLEVTGVLRSLGGHDLRLVEQDDNDPTTLTYEFLAVQNPAGQGVGTPHVRTVTAALALTDQELDGVRVITVISETNRRTVRR
ncbi:MAG: hypothetical protein EP318_12945 [Rhodobacteraceae bacterium]|nr:MAG: hypothetical protein EP318_12945 [Paracoccaceae bacterium]